MAPCCAALRRAPRKHCALTAHAPRASIEAPSAGIGQRSRAPGSSIRDQTSIIEASRKRCR
jgi:hypothetical protein